MRHEGRTSGPKVAKSNSIKALQRKGGGGAVKIGGLSRYAKVRNSSKVAARAGFEPVTK
jgi:hypothetical protein